MPGATSRLALPYPVPDDTVDVPRDVKALADKLDALGSIQPSLVTSLPANPVDGQEIYLDAGASVFWHLRYLTAGTRWLFLGGAPLFGVEGAADNVTQTTYTLLNGPSLLVKFTGSYIIEYGGQTQIVAGENGFLSPSYGAPANDADAVMSFISAGNPAFNTMRGINRPVNANTTVGLQSRMSVPTGRNFTSRWLKITPLILL